MNERLLLLLLLMIVPGPAATLAQVPAPPVTETSPGVPAGPPPQGSATGPRDNEQKPDTGTGRIAGRVIGGENGAPLRRAIVSLWGEGLREGRSATTNEAGRFEFKDLPAARINLNASKVGYVSIAEAQQVPVRAGTEVTANFALLPARTLTISGTAVDSEGKPVANGFIMVQEGPAGRRNMLTMSTGAMIRHDGTFTLANLTAGEYVLHVNADRGIEAESESAAVPVTLATEDISGLAIATTRGATIAGQVILDGGQGASLRPAELSLFVMPVEPVSPMSGGRAFTPKDDWTFEGIARESPVLIRGGEQSAAWRIKAVLQRGIDVTDTGVVFRPGERVYDVQIVLSNRLSVVTGSVAADGGGSAKDYVVVVFADDPNRWGSESRHIGSARPDQQGQFEVKGLPPGNYVALAVEYLEEGQDRDPEFLQDMRPSATSFALGEGERKTLSLKIVRRD